MPAELAEAEEAFVNAFVARDRRERWLSLLASERGRVKLLARLAHDFCDDLDPQFVHPKDAPPPDVAAPVRAALTAWAAQNPARLCHVIANSSEMDGRMMRLPDAEEDARLTFGAVILLVPDRIAYYHTERNGVNKQPFYLLFRP